jgi:hypothetical protein
MENWIKQLFGRGATNPSGAAFAIDPARADLNELLAESNRLAAEQERIKAARRQLAERIDAKLKGE